MNINQLSQTVNPGTSASTATSSSTGASSSAGTSSNSQITSNDFITLLVTQLQQQDPSNPVDPTQFVSQLVQFNTLEQIMQINQAVQNYAASATTNPPASTSAVNP
jgi:flagellar basal-body rod modification protein FlgD